MVAAASPVLPVSARPASIRNASGCCLSNSQYSLRGLFLGVPRSRDPTGEMQTLVRHSRSVERQTERLTRSKSWHWEFLVVAPETMGFFCSACPLVWQTRLFGLQEDGANLSSRRLLLHPQHRQTQPRQHQHRSAAAAPPPPPPPPPPSAKADSRKARVSATTAPSVWRGSAAPIMPSLRTTTGASSAKSV